jgi:hypothetical protein
VHAPNPFLTPPFCCLEIPPLLTWKSLLCVVVRIPVHSGPRLAVQGGAVNRGLKRLFSLYRPSCLIEAYDRPEKYWLVWAGPLASHLFHFNFIFLSDGLTAVAERAACFACTYRC